MLFFHCRDILASYLFGLLSAIGIFRSLQPLTSQYISFGRTGSQKPGFLAKYFIRASTIGKNPVSLSEMCNSCMRDRDGSANHIKNVFKHHSGSEIFSSFA